MTGGGAGKACSRGGLIAAAMLSLCARAQAPEFVMPEPIRSADEIQALVSDFTLARVRYDDNAQSTIGQIVYRDDGPVVASLVAPTGFWTTDYPDADRAFSAQVAARLGLDVSPEGVVVRLTDPELDSYPMLYLVEGGHLGLTDEEIPALRNYLLRGGFLMVDDFWGAAEWTSLALQLQRVFPDRPIVELPSDHDVFRSFYAIEPPVSVPGAAQLTGGSITETPLYRGIFGDDGRLMVILLFNQDFGDGWEHIEDPNYPKAYSLGAAVPLGINIVVYALTH